MSPISRANYGKGFHQTSAMDRKSANTFRPARQIALLLALFALMNPALSEIPSTNPTAGDDDSTVVYPANYFNQFFPVSANDMLSRIPGIDLALRGGRGGRGLGSGAGEILINGQRITARATEAAVRWRVFQRTRLNISKSSVALRQNLMSEGAVRLSM